jgi:hypothetical protein
MTTIVHIAETAFLSILVSAIEAFPSKYEEGNTWVWDQ